jgi:glucose/arabinose dehydrogenase
MGVAGQFRTGLHTAEPVLPWPGVALRRPHLAALVATFACGLAASPAAAVDNTVLPDGFEESDVGISGLSKPTQVEFAPDGRVFLLDEGYGLGPATNDGPQVKVKLPGSNAYQRLFKLPHVNTLQDRGLTGMALDRDFASNRYMYLLYTYEHTGSGPSISADSRTQRLTRVTVPDTVPPSPVVPTETVLLGSVGTPVSASQACPYPKTGGGAFDPNGDWTPYRTTDCIPSDSNEHAVDSVVVDPRDGTLWVSIGDGGTGGDFPDPVAFRSQAIDSLSGKLLHIDRDGKGLPTNGTCPGVSDLDRNCTKVYARGLRNPYRFSFRPDGTILVGDVGWKTREEVDLVSTGGKNYGWPCYEGTIQTPLWKDRPECVAFYNASTPHEPPVYDYAYPVDLDGAALIFGNTYTGTGAATDYPDEYKGGVFFSDFISGKLSYLKLNGGALMSGYPKPFGEVPDVVSWALAPNGDLTYVDIGFGVTGDSTPSVRQISAVQNHRPNAVISIGNGLPYGPTPLTVDFDASGSTDPDPGETDDLTFAWDLDGDGQTDDSTQENPPPRVYNDGSQNVLVTLEVTDPHGKSDVETLTLHPGNRPPTAPALALGTPTLYRGGQEMDLSASSSDPDPGDSSTIHWAAVIDHAGTHTHDLGTGEGNDFSFTADTVHDQPSTYKVTTYAEDERGLRSASQTHVLQPDKRTLRLESAPSGAIVNHGGVDHTAPYSGESTIGVTVGVSAAQTVFSGGLNHVFAGWSNGGARSQTFTMPPNDLTLTARYGTVLGPPAPPPSPPAKVPDKVAPKLIFNVRKGINVKKGRFSGTVSDPSGVRRVQLALRGAKKKAGKCRWWSKKAKKLNAKAAKCGKPAFMTAKLSKVGGKTKWTLSLGTRVPKGRYVLVFRATDGAGNVGAGRKPVTFTVTK